MKVIFFAVALLLVLSSFGCMTSAVIQEAHREPRPIESLAKKNETTGEMKAPMDHPKANYLLLPLTILADVVNLTFPTPDAPGVAKMLTGSSRTHIGTRTTFPTFRYATARSSGLSHECRSGVGEAWALSLKQRRNHT